MKRTALILALVLSLSLLCACAETPPPAETAPPQTTAPTETTVPPETIAPPETTEPIAEDPFADYFTLLEYTYPETNWLRNAMGCTFETPAEINLEFLFYSGFRQGSWDLLSPESEQYLIDQGFWRDMDIQPMPVSQIEEVLNNTFGTSLSECTIPEGWVYVETEDLYCSNHNDVYMVEHFRITDVTESPDGTVEIRYFVENFYNTATDDFLYTVDLILTLRRTEEGFQVVSNVLVDQNEYDSLYDRELIDIISTEEALADWAASEDPGSEEALANLTSLSPAFSELMTRASAANTFNWYGPERIEQLKAAPETAHYADHLAMLIACLRAS